MTDHIYKTVTAKKRMPLNMLEPIKWVEAGEKLHVIAFKHVAGIGVLYKVRMVEPPHVVSQGFINSNSVETVK